MIIKNAMVYNEDNTFKQGEIHIENKLIVNKTSQATLENEEIIDATGLYAIPGLTDIHFHGCVGYDFCDGTKEAIEAIAAYQASNGVTTICPATMTLNEETLMGICETAASYKGENGAILCGINMEGPYISVEKKGAQNPEFIRKPDIAMYRRMQEKSGDLIKLVAIAPEEEGAMEFISTLKDEVTLSLAHTTADYDIAKEAFENGASHVTHLYNAMPPFSHRAPGVIGAACDAQNCNVELICDGVHIHESAVRATFKMFGDDRIILISDSMMAAGMPDGEYTLGGQVVKVKGNKATLEVDGALAGSVTNLMDCMKHAVKSMGIPFESAVKCAAVNPAKAIGVYDQYGSITPGKVANIVLLDQELNVKMVILNGRAL